MINRINGLRAQAEAAIAVAGGSAELEELRVRYLGRKAELPNVLRGIAQLPPQERGPTGKAANQARQALEAPIAQRREPPRAGAGTRSTSGGRRTRGTLRTRGGMPRAGPPTCCCAPTRRRCRSARWRRS